MPTFSLRLQTVPQDYVWIGLNPVIRCMTAPKDRMYVYPTANTEAWLDGLVHAFAFFGAVPCSILYDNDRHLVAKIMSGAAVQCDVISLCDW